MTYDTFSIANTHRGIHCSDENSTTGGESSPAVPENTHAKIASLIRYVGTGAVVLSALIFMLQGIEDIGLYLRQWTWLGLMAAMAVGGVVCRIVLDDVKSARVFFVLATAIVPVQFSQLGGMLFHLLGYVNNETTILPVIQSLPVFWLVVDLFVTLALAITLAYLGFSILVRKSAMIVTAAFCILNVGMLLPVRDGWLATAILAVTPIIFIFLESKIFQRHIEFKTVQAYVLRALLLLPLVIMSVRNSFYIDSALGFCALGAVVSVLLVYGVSRWSEHYWVKEITLMMGAVTAIITWISFSLEVHINFPFVVIFVPLVLMGSEFSRLSTYIKNIYLGAAYFIALIGTLLMSVDDPSFIEIVICLAMGVGFVARGIVTQVKAPLYVGAIVSLVSVVTLLCVSIDDFTLISWFALAIGGCVLVLGASLVEKYGRVVMDGVKRIQAYD